MKKMFQMVPRANVPSTAFNLSHEKKLSADFGKLYPVLVEEVLPGDTWNVNTESFVRLAPMVSPVMHAMDIYIHYFFVPNRIIWDDWEEFITDPESGETVPTIDLDILTTEGIAQGSLGDHLGLPPNIGTGHVTWDTDEPINALPLRAYKKIWNDYYRDQDIDSEMLITDDSVLSIQERCWERDYFTSCRPTAQKGDPASVDVSITERSPALGITTAFGLPATGDIQLGTATGNNREVQDSASSDIILKTVDSASFLIEDLRLANRLQRWMERNMRSGSRYVEHLLAHWGVISDDARLDRAEYLGGGRSPIVISEVRNTFGSDDANAFDLGAMAGHGLNVGNTNKCTKHCKEHGWIIGLLSAIPRTAYYQGIHRKFWRSTIFDYYFPEFARLGEQEVLKRELYMQASDTDNTKTFGYQSRFSEYKYGNSLVAGDFRHDLKHMHWSRHFSSEPSLSQEFVLCRPDHSQIFADSTEDVLWIQLYHNIITKRKMPFFAEPTL